MYLFEFESRASWEDNCPPGRRLYETLDDFKELWKEFFSPEPSTEFLDKIMKDMINGQDVTIKEPDVMTLENGETLSIGYSQVDEIPGYGTDIVRIDGLPDEKAPFVTHTLENGLQWDMRFRLIDVGTPRRR